MGRSESQTTEIKQSLAEWREVIESVAAFATSQGGVVRIGFGPNGERVGVPLGKGKLEELANRIKGNTDPPQFPSITVDGAEDAAVITITVAESPVKPVWAFGRPMKRVGRTNQHLPREEAQRLTEVSTGRTWDTFACPDFALRELDAAAVEDYLARAGLAARTKRENLLKNLNLLTPDGKLCNGAVLLFGCFPQRVFPQAQVKCGRFKGIDSVDFLDEKTFDGAIISQLTDALGFIRRNTRQGIRITGRPEREIVPEYPEEAVREALINALCHRNYADTATIQVRIYDDRLEVWNPGQLPPELSLASLSRQHASHPRNLRLAGALYRARLIEQWGTGTVRILRACEKHGIKPEFTADMGMFIVRFPSVVARAGTVEGGQLGDRQRKALEHVTRNGRITSSEYESLFGLTKRQAQREIRVLVERESLAREGGGRSCYYVAGPGKACADRSA